MSWKNKPKQTLTPLSVRVSEQFRTSFQAFCESNDVTQARALIEAMRLLDNRTKLEKLLHDIQNGPSYSVTPGDGADDFMISVEKRLFEILKSLTPDEYNQYVMKSHLNK